MVELLNALNGMSPLAVIGLLALVIYLLVKNQKAVRSVSNNHLSGLPEMQADVKTIVRLLEQQNELLQRVNDGVIYLKARVNGKS